MITKIRLLASELMKTSLNSNGLSFNNFYFRFFKRIFLCLMLKANCYKFVDNQRTFISQLWIASIAIHKNLYIHKLL